MPTIKPSVKVQRAFLGDGVDVIETTADGKIKITHEIPAVITSLRAVLFPYCLERMPDGRYVFLNRFYKPLGFGCGYIANYQDFPVSYRIRLTKAQVAKLAHGDRSTVDRVYLYDDGSIPFGADKGATAAYLQRLEVLGGISTAITSAAMEWKMPVTADSA